MVGERHGLRDHIGLGLRRGRVLDELQEIRVLPQVPGLVVGELAEGPQQPLLVRGDRDLGPVLIHSPHASPA